MSRSFCSALAHALVCVFVLAAPAAAQWAANGTAVSGEMNDQCAVVSVSDGAGGAIMAWEDNRDGISISVYAQRIDADGNPLWAENGIPVYATEDFVQTIRIVSDGAGGAIILWVDQRAGSDDVYAQRIDADGNLLWAPLGVAVCGDLSSQWEVIAISDDAGGAIIAWSDWRNGNTDVYAQRIDSNGASLWTPDGIPVVSQMNDQYNPRIYSDRSGGAIIAWYDYRNGPSEIYSQRISSDGSALWAADGIPVCPGGDQYDFGFVCDGASVFVAWQEYRDMYDDIFLQRLDMNGSPLWDPGGIIASTYWGYKYSPRIAEDQNGGAIVLWYDERGDNYSVYAQRVNPDGGVVWDEEGVMVYNAAGDSELRIIADGSGGVFVPLDPYLWESDSYDIRVQHVDGNGNLLWPLPLGAAVCTAGGEQYAPFPIDDGSGGVIIAWEDMRNYMDFDIYAQRFGASGLWGTPNPVILSCLDVPGDQGGWVRIRTMASALDVAGETTSPILGYNAWRLIEEEPSGPTAALERAGEITAVDESELLARLSDPASAVGVQVDGPTAILLGLPEGEWESVGFWFATRDTVYTIAVPTKNDSTEAGIPWEVYMVTAHSTTAGVYAASEPDTGYSVDNLAPGVTEGLEGYEVASPAGLSLTWTANTAPDLARYDIHRGLDALFVPDGSTLLASTAGTEYLDETWMLTGGYFYKLVAVDRHGNMSPEALLAPEDVHVATLLQSFAAGFKGSAVEITWVLSEAGADFGFEILRAEGTRAAFEKLTSTEITSDGLSFTFVDTSVEPGTSYSYRVDVIDEAGTRTLFETEAIETPQMQLTLQQNHPNPFNPSTSIVFYLPAAAPVTLEIYDAAGRRVSRLFDGSIQERGTHTVEWRGTDDAGRTVSSGVYFYRLRAGKETISRKMVLLR
ncbi:MAG TPA: T9SS type A sorting domain-containing protein [Candidatus Eisenbacteria bacterium]|uniref:T9SS type A sorting domain-containing protein n=1 Tax=Eiseniibacteriota bacterium TaxID=2212470 RepID=A0A7V2F4R7_UNCEI|nr:T9SS type A sorting domain-containing protein [Candidatus Eisenbacteria bacterium]